MDHPSALAVPGPEAPAPVASREVEAAARPRRGIHWLPPIAAAVAGTLSLLVPLGWSGLWAPHELEIADLSRRIAVALHGASGLALDGGNNSVPILSELGKGQLPFSLVALGFQVFGLSDWAGRLPIALCALIGLGATYLLVARFIDRVAGVYAALVLATTPLYFIQARTMLGDGVTVGAVALATLGACSAIFRSDGGRRARLGWSALALVGLAAGFASRGLLFGVACPALGVGLGWAVWRLSGARCPDRTSDVIGALSTVLGAIALGVGCWVLMAGTPALYLELLGAKVDAASKLPTHDAVLQQLGFGLLPWSAIAPFAIAVTLRLSLAPTPEAALRICLVNVCVVAVLVHGASSPFIGALPFVGTFALAAIVGIAFRDIERLGLTTRLLALATAALLIVFYADLREAPEHSLAAFAVKGADFPESFASDAKAWMKYGALGCLALMLLGFSDLPAVAASQLFGKDSDYARWSQKLRTAWRGKLLLSVGVLSIVLGALPVLILLEGRGVRVPLVGSLGAYRGAARVAFSVIPLLLAAPFAVWLARDLVGVFLSWLPVPRGRLAFAGFVAFGLTSSLGYYPALAAHLSPRNVFESFQSRAKPGDALAVLGQAARVAPYYATGQVHTPKAAREGLDWLLASTEQRRWLVLAARDLGQLENLYRQRVNPPANLPILDAKSSEVLLATNRLGPGETNQNPLAAMLSATRPNPERPLTGVDLNGQLNCLGWGVTDRDGRPVDQVRAGVPYDFKIYWEVTAPITSNWQTFIHVDGHRRRFNGDHDTLQGKYPFRLWQKGDFITDVHVMELEPHFAGATYQVYFGLFSGDKRLAVRSGKHQDDRIMGGNLVVR